MVPLRRPSKTVVSDAHIGRKVVEVVEDIPSVRGFVAEYGTAVIIWGGSQRRRRVYIFRFQPADPSNGDIFVPCTSTALLCNSFVSPRLCPLNSCTEMPQLAQWKRRSCHGTVGTTCSSIASMLGPSSTWFHSPHRYHTLLKLLFYLLPPWCTRPYPSTQEG